MKYRPQTTILSFALILMLFGVMGAPALLAQKNRAIGRDRTTQLVSWQDWSPLGCERCESKKKTDCGTCNAGRKDLPHKCLECKGKKKADCRDCFGTGKYEDPHLVTRCVRCDGRRFVPCWNCGANGHIMYRGGEKGAKCKVCSKKCVFKCWICKSKSKLSLMQPDGTSYTKATEAQIDAISAKIKPVFDKLESFTGSQNQDNPKTRFKEEDYEEAMAAVTDLFPEWKSEVKEVKSWTKKILKHKEIPDNKKRPGQLRKNSAVSAQNFIARHMNIISSCKKVFDENKRITELKRRKKQEAGGGK